MAKLFDFQWQSSVPESLLQGGRFDRWEEVSSLSLFYTGWFKKAGRSALQKPANSRAALEFVGLWMS